MVLGTYTALQGLALGVVPLPGSVHTEFLADSLQVNLALDGAILAYLALNLVAPRRRWDAERILRLSTNLLVALILAGWGFQLHFGGSQSSHMLALILATLVVVAWLLPERTAIAFTLGTSLYICAIVGLEMSGRLPYSPLVHGREDLADVFLDSRIIAMNAVIYLCVVGVTVTLLLSLRRALRRGEASLQEKNELLEGQVAARSRAELTLQRAVEELSATNSSQQGLIRGAAHDLRSPLSSIAGFAELLDNDLESAKAEDMRRWIKHIHDGVWQMSTLLDDLSQLVLCGQDAADLSPCQVGPVFDRVAGILDAELRATGASIQRGALPTVLAQESRLAQVFQNLMGNALKFRGDAPLEIQVDAVREGDLWVISIRDNGIGFDPAQAERIFEPFERLVLRDRYPGHGVGLSVCRLLIAGMGGRMWAESKPGQGSTFHFTLLAG